MPRPSDCRRADLRQARHRAARAATSAPAAWPNAPTTSAPCIDAAEWDRASLLGDLRGRADVHAVRGDLNPERVDASRCTRRPRASRSRPTTPTARAGILTKRPTCSWPTGARGSSSRGAGIISHDDLAPPGLLGTLRAQRVHTECSRPRSCAGTSEIDIRELLPTIARAHTRRAHDRRPGRTGRARSRSRRSHRRRALRRAPRRLPHELDRDRHAARARRDPRVPRRYARAPPQRTRPRHGALHRHRRLDGARFRARRPPVEQPARPARRRPRGASSSGSAAAS